MPLDDIRHERIKKIETLRREGMEPYPADVRRTHLIGEVLEKFGSFIKSKRKVTIAGRVMAKREHGGSAFVDIRDASGKIQAYFRQDVLNSRAVEPPKDLTRSGRMSEPYQLFIKTVDIGDFLEVGGRLFKTKKGEETIEVFDWRMLAKSLRPLPEKWYGLQDVEERFRRRYLDLLMNEGVRERFEMRSKIIKALREFHEKRGFLEVETPMLHPIPGGALAKPFITHHNALDIDLYLRIAPELYLKRLLVGGFERVYEIGKSFRNEGIDASHNPEFTMLECYAAYWDEEKMMKFVEDLLIYLIRLNRPRSAAGSAVKNEFEFEGQKISFQSPFPRITFKELLKRYALITDYDSETRDSLATRARRLGLDVGTHESKGKIADEIYKKICRPYLVQPTFVINHPREISPLAKASIGPRQGREASETISSEARRFQLIVAGLELANGFAELNDPLEQRKMFEEQEKMRAAPVQFGAGGTLATAAGGEMDDEAHPMDEEYLEALEYGLPPAAGLGIGVDRLVMLFTDTKNIREAVLFPTMRPKKN